MTVAGHLATRSIPTPHGDVQVVTRVPDDTTTPEDRVVVFVHGADDAVDEATLEDLPSDVRAIAVDAASPDVLAETLDELRLSAVNLVAWAGGEDTVAAFAAHHDNRSVTVHAAKGGTPAVFRHTLLQAIGYIAQSPDPAPPTEVIILKSED